MRAARRRVVSEGLTITSLMDAMTIILCFLLKSYQADDIHVAGADELSLPASSALPTVKTAVQIVLTRTGLLVDGDLVATVVEEDDGDGSPTWFIDPAEGDGELIRPLHIRLADRRAEVTHLQDLVEDDVDFEGRVLLEVDREMPYQLVRQALFTAGQAGFGKIQFVVVKS